MTLKRKNPLILVLAGFLMLNGCALKQMIKMSKDQELTVTPNPLELHGDSVSFEISALLPLKMLKKNKIYTVSPVYKYGEESITMADIEFKSTDFPDAKTEQPKVGKKMAFFYKPEIGNGDLLVKGTAYNAAKTKSKSSEFLPVAKGIITTSRLLKDYHFIAYADHGYNNKPEYIPMTINFYFDQGRANLKKSEITGQEGKKLDAFIASKNVTKTVTIVGQHSPEGTERANTQLSEQRAQTIEQFYRSRMKHYDYKNMADSIKFVTKGVVQDWEPFKAELAETTVLTDDQKNRILEIVNSGGTFEEKEKNLQSLPYYKTILNKVYPKLRVARTEVLTLKPKKSDAEITVLAKQIVDGTVSPDTLNLPELLYAATLTPILKEKEAIYQAAVKKSDTWEVHNNLGAVYLEMAKKEVDQTQKLSLVDKAVNQFEISIKAKDNAAGHSNKAVALMMKSQRPEALQELEKAVQMDANDDLKKGIHGMKGAIEIREGKYTNAVQSLSKSNDSTEVVYNLALANLMKKDLNAAKTGFGNVTVKAPNDAWGYYLSAVTASRMQDEGSMATNLKKAVQLESSMAEKAMNDLEFMNYWNSENFKKALMR